MHQSRILTALGGFLLLVSIGAFFFINTFMRYVSEMGYGPLLLTAIPFLAGTAALMYGYLRGGTAQAKDQASPSLSAEIRNLAKQFEELQSNSSLQGGLSGPLTVEQQKELSQRMQSHADSVVTADVLKRIENHFFEQIRSNELTHELDKLCDRTEDRLRQEIEALSRRGTVNLVIGVLTTLVAVAILASTVMFDNSLRDLMQLTTHFVPRVTLSLFIEVFSFFFLRLYSSNLAEIKYFQNELTNMESRFIAVRRAAHANDKATLSKLLIALASTERNFVLKKGETTADLERAKLDSTQNKELMSLLRELTKQSKTSRE